MTEGILLKTSMMDQMKRYNLWMLAAFFFVLILLALVSCTKEGNTIYLPNPDEEQPSTAPLVTVIYGPNGLGDRSYFDQICMGVEAAAKKYGVRTLQLSPESEEQGLTYLETMFQQMENTVVLGCTSFPVSTSATPRASSATCTWIKACPPLRSWQKKYRL